MQNNKTPSKDRTFVLHVLGICMWSLVIILASHKLVSAQAFIQSYESSGPLQQGIIVQLSQNTSEVEPASQSAIYQTFGVVVNSSDAPVALTNSNSNGSQTFVASTGHYNVLVSDQNGPINSGNYITLSSINGVGMKNTNTEPIVIGQAITSFGSNTPSVGTDTIKTASGRKEVVHLGLVQADISIGHNPLVTQIHSSVPKVLQKLTIGVTGKNDPAWRIYLGMSVMLIIAILTSTMIYSAVRNSLIAIGRNPLSRSAIRKGFIRVIITALIIFISGILGVYLLLKA